MAFFVKKKRKFQEYYDFFTKWGLNYSSVVLCKVNLTFHLKRLDDYGKNAF